jgi:hypothetical protein
MRSIFYYRVYCTTESTNVFKWSDTTPTTCPNNNSHTIDESSITIIDSLKDNNVNVIDEVPPEGKPPTQGRFRCNGLECEIPANSYLIKDFGWVYQICALSIRFNVQEANVGDYIDLYVVPNIKLGNTNANIEIDDTVIPLTTSCFNACSVGMQLFIMDNNNTFFLGAVISKNTETNSITITNSSDHHYHKNAYITLMSPVGVITQNITPSDNLITVNSTVTDNMETGLFITVTNGVTMDNLGEIFEIDKVNGTILIQTPSSLNYNAGCYLFPSVHVIKDYKLNASVPSIIGESSIGGSYVPAFYIIRLVYRNQSNATKNFNWYVEYKY